MKGLIFLITLLIFLPSCKSMIESYDRTQRLFAISYSTKLIKVNVNGESKPVTNVRELFFEDDVISIQWGVGHKDLSLLLKNKTNMLLSIDWENSFWIGQNNYVEKLVNVEQGNNNRSRGRYTTKIASNGLSQEKILPESNIVWNEEKQEWETQFLLVWYANGTERTKIVAEEFNNSNFRIILTLYTVQSRYEYEFIFESYDPITANNGIIYELK